MPLPYDPDKLARPFPEAVAHVAQVMGEYLENEIAASGETFTPNYLHSAGIHLGSLVVFGLRRGQSYSHPVPAPMLGADMIGFKSITVPHETVRRYGMEQAIRVPQRVVRFALFREDARYPKVIDRYQMFIAPHLPPTLLDHSLVHRLTDGQTDNVEDIVEAASAHYDPPGPAVLDESTQRAFIDALVRSDDQISINVAKQRVFEAFRNRLSFG